MSFSNVIRGLRHGSIWLRRFLALSSPGIILYFAIGSRIFPDWYYELFWRGGYADADFWQGGIEYWLETPILLISVGLLLAIAYAVIRPYWSRFLPFLDRIGTSVILFMIVSLFVIALAVQKWGQAIYDPAQQIAALTEAYVRLQQTTQRPPRIFPPVDFQYIDKNRVQALYSQIEPELVESERKVDTTGEFNGKAGVKAGAIEAEAGGSKRQEATSTYERAPTFPEKQCLDVMNFVLTNSQARYYTDRTTWINQKSAADFQLLVTQQGLQGLAEGIKRLTKNGISTPPIGGPLTDNSTAEDKQEAAREGVRQYDDQLRSELTSLRGMVILDAEFSVSRTGEGNLLLTERFSDPPRPIIFRVAMPSAIELSRIASLGKARLIVFGTVLKPLDNTNSIEVSPLAIY